MCYHGGRGSSWPSAQRATLLMKMDVGGRGELTPCLMSGLSRLSQHADSALPATLSAFPCASKSDYTSSSIGVNN